MNEEIVVERLFQTLITGDRVQARRIVDEVKAEALTAEEITHSFYWPALEMLNQLFRADQLTTLAHHYAIRLLRSLVDQAQACYTQRPRRDRKILMFSGAAEADEMSALIVSDLIEADGYQVLFGGGGIANDEILEEVGTHRPDVLLMFSSGPTDAPNIRLLIDHIREVAACPEMQIIVGGGVFNRAEGLAEEIGADLWAKDGRELLQRLGTDSARRATDEQRTVGRTRRSARSRAA